ncbi:hypothetical protein ENUP19_0367G0012 [Entamoeba nuttalli]|uniref:Ubiquitin thioesterase OTU n=2 Tax=Entamoeba nuttalli TaxID=412467 RepID=K2H550_ENTNP|nr:OTU family cysteine protease, putative [Entamoeba nuttalli P19]EKE41532.1 OTU family cysteine protease, putative [Entamoeba nuttalli P19]|eukprot:XP_008856135.1 OTU family cysteine protease, putative [Entamoeba nuttalli P19]
MKLMIQDGNKKVKIEVEEDCTVGELKCIIASEFSIEPDLIGITILNKEINVFDDELAINVGIKNMTMIRITHLDQEEKKVKQGTSKSGYIVKIDRLKWVPIRRKMAADNSCLFHCLEYLFYNKSRNDPYHIRQEVSEIVQLYPQKFTTDYLGQPNSLYYQNILNPKTWGSNVEISIYSFLKECQIIVFDFENKVDITYGDKSLNRCCFIIFTGNHFDVLCLSHSLNSPENEDMVLFNNEDEEVKMKMKNYILSECPKFHFTF